MKARLLTAICVTAAIAVVEGQSALGPTRRRYRDWSHIRTMVIEEGHPLDECHRRYARRMTPMTKPSPAIKTDACQSARSIAFDLLEALRADNAVTEAARQVLGEIAQGRV